MSDGEERRREREHEKSVLEAMGDIRFFRARNMDVDLHPGNGGVREHLILLPQPSLPPPSDATDAREVTKRVTRLSHLEKSEEGRGVIRDALMRLELEDRMKEGDWE
jgi:hypothetical protein